MKTSRREFVIGTAAGGITLASGAVLRFKDAVADSSFVGAPRITQERVAAAACSPFRPYRSKTTPTEEATTWVQIDLGSSKSFEVIHLCPDSKPNIAGHGFPRRCRIETSEDPGFKSRTLLADCTKTDIPDPSNQVVELSFPQAKGRYVRLTATLLRGEKYILPPAQPSRESFLALSRIEVLSAGYDLALGRPVLVDEVYGNEADAAQLTRPLRPQGEGVITDNPQNVTASDTWKPVPYLAEAPRGGVELGEGLFKTTLQNNVRYLLDSYTKDDLLRHFRQRAGKQPIVAAAAPTQVVPIQEDVNIWPDLHPGSNAGRFLMGAGNALRWLDDPQLRQRMNDVVDGIAECRQSNGYIMAYPEETLFDVERGAYTRSWVTHGLIEAGVAGNPKAFELLRGYYDWYNQMPYLPQALRRCGFGPQGTAANTRMYFTPVGKPQDLQIVQRYLQENYWLDDLVARKPEAIWQYPYDRPHCYLVTCLEPYLDLYRATGDRRYFDAARGGWELFRENWENVGGSLSIIESVEKDCPPKSHSLYRPMGETCGSAFWMLLNQRFHLLSPEEETYVAEIEKSIYNVLLANQVGSKGIRYHSMLVGKKEPAQSVNSCCEVVGTRLLSSLPEFIYSIAPDGLYVNLFEPSAINWEHQGKSLRLEMHTSFPKSPQVRLQVTTDGPVQAKIRVRTPSWAAGPMEIEVNGERAATGMPGSYVTLERKWRQGDAISFVLPMALRMTPYIGVDQIAGHQRFALEYGPLLMAVVNGADGTLLLNSDEDPSNLLKQFSAMKDEPLHFKTSSGLGWMPGFKIIPYFEVADEPFSCFPVVTFAS